MKYALSAILLATTLVFLFFSCSKPAPVAELTLRDAMQERMNDVLRLREALDNGGALEKIEFTRFAGLPNSEFVDDVSEYQAYFDIFDQQYNEIFTSIHPEQKFNTIIKSCAACHENVCPGPLRAIQRLEIGAKISG